MNVYQKHHTLSKREAANQLVFWFFESSALVNPSSCGTEMNRFLPLELSASCGVAKGF